MFQMAEQLRRVLHLVDHQRRRVAAEKRCRITLRLLGLAGQIEAHQLVIRKQPLYEAGLAGLAGTGQHQDRPLCGALRQVGLDVPLDPHFQHCTSFDTIEQFPRSVRRTKRSGWLAGFVTTAAWRRWHRDARHRP